MIYFSSSSKTISPKQQARVYKLRATSPKHQAHSNKLMTTSLELVALSNKLMSTSLEHQAQSNKLSAKPHGKGPNFMNEAGLVGENRPMCYCCCLSGRVVIDPRPTQHWRHQVPLLMIPHQPMTRTAAHTLQTAWSRPGRRAQHTSNRRSRGC